MMETILYIVGALVAGFIIGYRVSTSIYTESFMQILKDLKVTEADVIKAAELNGIDTDDLTAKATTNIDLRVEREGGQLFAYRKDTGQFLAQAVDKETLLAALTAGASVFKTDVKFRIADEDGAEYL